MHIKVIIIALIVIIIGVVVFFLHNVSYDLNDFIKSLNAKGYECEIEELSGQNFFPVHKNVLKVKDAQIYVYEFMSFKQSYNFSKKINYSGFTINGTMISWVNLPHFYIRGKVIVQYLGEDVKIVKMLESILGKQFAGL